MFSQIEADKKKKSMSIILIHNKIYVSLLNRTLILHDNYKNLVKKTENSQVVLCAWSYINVYRPIDIETVVSSQHS